MVEKAKATEPQKRSFKRVESTFADPWQPQNKGDVLLGTYVGTELADGKKKNEKFRVYKIKDENGKAWSISGATLKSVMRQIPRGTFVQVTFMGTDKTRDGNEMKLWDVACESSAELKDAYDDEDEDESDDSDD